jgi:hypothetical protein
MNEIMRAELGAPKMVDRGNFQAALDALTVYGRQERWEDSSTISPLAQTAGPQRPKGAHNYRTDGRLE